MDRVETLAAALGEDGDEVDDRVGAVDGAVDRPAVAEIGLDRLDPADHAERLEMAGEIGPADGGAHAPAALQERADDMAAEEARAAEDRDQPLVGGDASPFPRSLSTVRSGSRWCPGKDSNLHALRHTDLNRARLPIPPPGQSAAIRYRAGPESCQRGSRQRAVRRAALKSLKGFASITPAMTIRFHKGDLPDTSRYRGAVAIDTETLGLNPHRDRLCLVQLSPRRRQRRHRPDRARPERGAATSPRSSPIPAVTKIFHYARFDIAVLFHAFGVMAAPLFCTKIASRLTRTYTDRHGLKDLVKDLLDIDISKQQQSSDWAAETLTEAQLAYAASDVLHLHALRERLDERLDREGRRDLAEACFALPADAGPARPRRLGRGGHFRPLRRPGRRFALGGRACLHNRDKNVRSKHGLNDRFARRRHLR